MARNIDDIIDAMPVARRRKIEKRAAALMAEEMTLQQLRRAREMTQVTMAKSLGVAQKQISNIEKRTDMHISTLRRSIEALGGRLSMIAEFPNREPVTLVGIAPDPVLRDRKPTPSKFPRGHRVDSIQSASSPSRGRKTAGR